jgi:hypothetical protein
LPSKSPYSSVSGTIGYEHENESNTDRFGYPGFS